MHKPISKLGWISDFDQRHPAFGQLPGDLNWPQFSNWPDCQTLNKRMPAGARNQQGKAICFYPQDGSLPWPGLYYEQRIAQHGIIATRENWHDFFNAMIWCLYPDTKAAISARHAGELNPASSRRTRSRDALTLFDENGALIVSSNAELLRTIVDFNWHKVFVGHRQDWHRCAHCYVVGHALFEKLLTPYVGITANTILIHVDENFFTLRADRQRQLLDRELADALNKGILRSPRNLSPFPILGVPGWWNKQNSSFFNDTHYFREKTTEREATILTLSV